MATPRTSASVYALLSKLWPKDGYAMIPEVGNSTGAGTSRHADAIVMSLWPSRGLTITGVEIKVSRSDWLSELKNPRKAEAIAKYCDGWYLAVSESAIVKAGELPPTWGMIACDGGKPKITTPAPKLTPQQLDKGFVAAMLRRAAEFSRPESWIHEYKCEESKRQEALWKDQFEARIGRELEKVNELKERVAEIETALGMSLMSSWASKSNLAKIRAAMDFLAAEERLQDRLESARAAAHNLKESAGAVEKHISVKDGA